MPGGLRSVEREPRISPASQFEVSVLRLHAPCAPRSSHGQARHKSDASAEPSFLRRFVLADYMSVRIGCRYPRSMPRGCIRARTSRMGSAQTSRTRDKKPHTTPLQRTHQQRPVTPGAFRLRAPEAGAWPRRAPAGRSWVWARKKEGRRNCAQTRPTRGRKSPHLWCRSPFTRVYRQQPRLLKLAARATAPRALERPRTRPKQPSPQELKKR